MRFFSWLGLLLLLLCSGQLLLAADLGGNVAATGEGPADNAAADLEGMTDSLALWLQQVWEAAQVHLEAAVQAIRYRTGFCIYVMRRRRRIEKETALLWLLFRIWFYPLSFSVIIADNAE